MARIRARVLPLLGVILKVQLAKCWKPRESSGTHSLSHPRRRLAIVNSDKPSGAGNQQERPLAAEWVVGFVDGEGCFSIPIFQNRTCRLGWQVQPEFAVVQGERSVSVLHALEKFFGCGWSVGQPPARQSPPGHLALWRPPLGGPTGAHRAILRSKPSQNGQSLRFHKLCRRGCDDVRRRPSHDGRLGSNRGPRGDDESSEAVAVSGILRGHTPANSSRRVS
jgi:LAGLIDADG endonuclease